MVTMTPVLQVPWSAGTSRFAGARRGEAPGGDVGGKMMGRPSISRIEMSTQANRQWRVQRRARNDKLLSASKRAQLQLEERGVNGNVWLNVCPRPEGGEDEDQ